MLPKTTAQYGSDAIGKFLWFKKGWILCIKPVAKLSKQRTFTSSFNKASHKFDPINPAPPVTKTVLFFKFLNIIIILRLLYALILLLRHTPLISFSVKVSDPIE